MCPCLVLPQSLREWLQLLMLLYATFIILFHWRRGPPRQTPHPPGPEEPEESPPPAPSDTDSESPSDSETSPIAAFPIQRLPYHEPTITTLITQIYHLYLQLDYIQPHELIYPPPETGHAINEALCAALGLAPAVISLMKRLPYFQTSSLAHDIPFTPRSQAFVYLEDEEIRGGRDPEWYGTRAPDPGFLLPWELALTFATDEGVHWILDTRENTLRVWDRNKAPAGGNVEDYRAYSAHHAPTYLARYLKKLRALEVIPSAHAVQRGFWGEEWAELYPRIKRTLQEQYGWPYAFREEEWKAASAGVWERAFRMEPALR